MPFDMNTKIYKRDILALHLTISMILMVKFFLSWKFMLYKIRSGINRWQISNSKCCITHFCASSVSEMLTFKIWPSQFRSRSPITTFAVTLFYKCHTMHFCAIFHHFPDPHFKFLILKIFQVQRVQQLQWFHLMANTNLYSRNWDIFRQLSLFLEYSHFVTLKL